ncbi:MAG: response regulator transcription factor [Vicinamibacterales bacterium]
MTLRSAGQKRVLLVEDDAGIRDVVQFHLGLARYETTTAVNGKEALLLLQTRTFDVVVLDIVLPGVDGITLCQTTREAGPNREVPMMMLTARREESDTVLGLTSGADDYLTKPFGVREFLARIEALLRRPRSTWRTAPLAREQPSVSSLGITIDPERRRVVCDDRPTALTPQEFDLLYLLMSHPGVVFDRDEILTRVWSDDVNVTHRGVDTLVKRLRRKVEVDPGNPTRVLTVWGAGYKFAEPS